MLLGTPVAHMGQILAQKCGSFVNTQVLQTLNILFENLSNNTSICSPCVHVPCRSQCPDYLLSNNHMNSIITHEYDFANEEARCCGTSSTLTARRSWPTTSPSSKYSRCGSTKAPSTSSSTRCGALLRVHV